MTHSESNSFKLYLWGHSSSLLSLFVCPLNLNEPNRSRKYENNFDDFLFRFRQSRLMSGMFRRLIGKPRPEQDINLNPVHPSPRTRIWDRRSDRLRAEARCAVGCLTLAAPFLLPAEPYKTGPRRIHWIFHHPSFVMGSSVCSVRDSGWFCSVHNGAGSRTSAEQKLNQVTEASLMTPWDVQDGSLSPDTTKDIPYELQ